MSRLTSVVVLLAPFALAGPSAAAEAPEVPQPVEALVAEALERNPEILAAERAAAAARERPAQARALPNPTVSVGYVNDGWSPSLGQRDMTTLGVMASQDLPFPGKRALRATILDLEGEAAEQSLKRVRLRVGADVKREYLGAIEAQDLLALTKEQRTVWQDLESVARTRYSVGESSQQDVIRAQIELTRLDQVLATEGAALDIRKIALLRLLDREPGGRLELGTWNDDGGLSATPPEPAAGSAAVEPEVASGGLAVRRAAAAVDLARRDFKPDFAVEAGYMNRGGLDPMWQVGVSVTLPTVRSRLRAELAEATAARSSEEARLRAVRRLLSQRTEERVVELQAAVRSVDIYRRALVPQDRLSVESALAGYRTGRVPFVAVLEALNTLFGDRSTLTRLTTSARRLQVALEEASLDPRTELSASPMETMAGVSGAPAPSAGGAAPMAGSMSR